MCKRKTRRKIAMTEVKLRKVTRKKRNVKRFSIELDPEDYELLSEMAEIMDMTKAQVVRIALRHYFSYTMLSLYAPEFREFFKFIREKLIERRK